MDALPPFWTLVEAHGNELLAHARRLADDAAEDVLQEALLRALRSYPRLEHGNHVRAWLYRITTTTAFDLVYPRLRREVPVGDLPEVAVAADEPDVAFEELIAELPEGPRAALRLRFVDDLDYRRIGARLGCSEVAARQRVSTAVKTLRRKLS